MAHKTAYQCLVCGKPLTHATSMVLSTPGTPKVLVHKGRCFSKYRSNVRHGAARVSHASNAPIGPTPLPPRIAPIVEAPTVQQLTVQQPTVQPPMVQVESSKDDVPSGMLGATVPVVSSASVGNTSTASSNPIPTTTPVYTNTFSTRVLAYRKTHNLTQLDLAKRVGYKNASTVCAIEKGNITRPTERVYDIGTLLGLLRHETDMLLATREKVIILPPKDIVPPPAPYDHTAAPYDHTAAPYDHTESAAKSSPDTDLTIKSARCNNLPYTAAAAACKALVLHILKQPTMPDMVLLGKLVEIGWGPLGREPQLEPSIGGGTGGTNA